MKMGSDLGSGAVGLENFIDILGDVVLGEVKVVEGEKEEAECRKIQP